ncbi:ATP-binding protein [Pasteurella skyensis]|uniref:histidine kinase n=1 Tax=Phocoenobacter skyensis TaxID=97481 RepID=A0AAJ6NAG3_9PAST|nr:ATP-binding protein [Pasteurella skyensis]MDP8162720.1 ATP-binding protein [Pasteurella skyensis]MDP8173191.1 ATP-binding protein [Pasteurella skyensis]MDP8177592.1 ATP-binding protein [Pasteurella skyensis]MDP8178822.1 ATP-binding protein [Pasteurella skyensis]MDP8183122.1 ATP-binding protein [Pasteurella skyensis]
MKKSLFTNGYNVRFRLIIFVILTIIFISFISVTAILGLNNTYNSLSDLRSRSQNQIFFSMTLGVKTAQISSYSTRLIQTMNALEYKEQSQQLSLYTDELRHFLSQLKLDVSKGENQQLIQVVKQITLLEETVQKLLLNSHQRHILNTELLSSLHQLQVHIRRIKQLEKDHPDSPYFLFHLEKLEKLSQKATESHFSTEVFIGLQSIYSFLPQLKNHTKTNDQLGRIKNILLKDIKQAETLTKINLEIKSLTYQINALVKKINADYARVISHKFSDLNAKSQFIQQYISTKTSYIFAVSFIAILLLIFIGFYFYSLLGKRLYSITQALKRLSQGDKTAQVPQQQIQDEIGDLARAFHRFYQYVVKLEQTDALLKEKSELLEQTFSTMRDGFVIFDEKMQIISCNEEFKELLNEFMNNPTEPLNIETLAVFFNQKNANLYGKNTAITPEILTTPNRDQELLEIEFNHQILEWRSTTLENGLVAFLINRTERKKLESDLAHSQKMQTIGHLTGGIAHDFNNFLAIIIGNLDLIDPETLTEKQQKRLHRALKAAENSAELTQRLLAYARKQPLHPKDLNLNKLILEFNDLIKHSIPPNIQVELELADNLPPIYIDKAQLETALMNLIVNAKDALMNGGKIIIRSTVQVIKRTRYIEKMVQLSIIDNGCGMDKETQKRIFEPFFTTKGQRRGNGLGLSMVYGFIRQSKGRVVVQSKINEGTTIHLQLPLSKNQYSQHIVSDNKVYLPHQKSKILVIEDKEDLRLTLMEQLNNLGYLPLICASSKEAIEQLNSETDICYLLSDIVLSEKMTGLEIAKFVKETYPTIKILLMTGHTEQLEKTKDFPILTKPFRQQDLATALQHL